MRVDPHDIFEALIQAPGEQILELGNEIEAFRKMMVALADVTPGLRDEIDERLAYFAARTREIEPVVEKLQEIVDLHHQPPLDDELKGPTGFMARQQPPFAAALLYRLAAARAVGDVAKAAGVRDDAATYARTSPIRGVRDVLVDGLRLDAFAHGETKPGYCIASLKNVRRQALSCVPD